VTDHAAIEPLDEAAMAATRAHLDRLTKPPGSLGRLERLVVQLAGITGSPTPRVDRPAVVVFAGDHGVTARGVSAYPSDVTAQMVANFVRGGRQSMSWPVLPGPSSSWSTLGSGTFRR
jgi:nicotinate-nucleotide--dimethylbenzimidazole phosphoribosyltransferase